MGQSADQGVGHSQSQVFLTGISGERRERQYGD
jgi:hypothetical protein